LEGHWHCFFLRANNAFEASYFSVWTFDSKRRFVDIFYSPVHKGFVYRYRWEGQQLTLVDPADHPQFTITMKGTDAGGELVLEDNRLRWQGWRCRHQPDKQWPADGLKYLDYGRYPWLSRLVEDDSQISKYRNPR